MQKGRGGMSESEAGRYLVGADDLFRMETVKRVVLLGSLPVMLDAPYSTKRYTV